MSVFMAFDYFASMHVDIAIVEVGLGGRLDSTNVITPLLSVITNIGMDHTEFLGNTLESIAGEKAGIVKEKIPVIIGESQKATRDVFTQTASQKEAPIYFADEKYAIDYSLLSSDGLYQLFNIRQEDLTVYPELETDLLGAYQKKNIITTLMAIDILKEQGFNLILPAIRKGLKNVTKTTGLMGRWQVAGHNPLTICDNAHNAEGITEVVQQIANTAYRKLHFVVGVVKEKKLDNILKVITSRSDLLFHKSLSSKSIE